MHKSGFINIIGNPNVGKSTLMNNLVGEKLSIITSKAQTTRHRILGIVNGDNFQLIFSDTPGIIKPSYELQDSMMDFVKSALEDADVILYMVEIGEKSIKDPDRAGVEHLRYYQKRKNGQCHEDHLHGRSVTEFPRLFGWAFECFLGGCFHTAPIPRVGQPLKRDPG